MEKEEEEEEEPRLLNCGNQSHNASDDEKSFTYTSPTVVRKYSLEACDFQRIVDLDFSCRVRNDAYLRDWIFSSVRQELRQKKNGSYFEGSIIFWENLSSDWEKAFAREKLKNPNVRFYSPYNILSADLILPDFIHPDPQKDYQYFPPLIDSVRVCQYKFGLTMISSVADLEVILVDARLRKYEQQSDHRSASRWRPPTRFLWTYQDCLLEAIDWLYYSKEVNPPDNVKNLLNKGVVKYRISVWKRPVDVSSNEIIAREILFYAIARSSIRYGQSKDSVKRCLANALLELDNEINLGFMCSNELVL
jgi:hypothetical protein